MEASYNSNFGIEQQEAILRILEDNSHQKNLKTLGDYSQMMSVFYTHSSKNKSTRNEVNRLFAEYFQNISDIDQTVYTSPQTYVIRKLN